MITGEVSFRKAYLSAIVDRIEVGDGLVRIVNLKDVPERAVLTNNDAVPRVRGFVRKWRTGQDSTPQLPESKFGALLACQRN